MTETYIKARISKQTEPEHIGMSIYCLRSASELRLEQFAEAAKPQQQNAELPLHASEQEDSR